MHMYIEIGKLKIKSIFVSDNLISHLLNENKYSFYIIIYEEIQQPEPKF
jgi:hypothetical protein